MKKRRTLIISLLLVAALALGIGYAGFTSELSVNGEAILGGVKESQVKLLGATIKEQTSEGDKLTLNVEGENTKALSLDVLGFEKVGDSALITVTIDNPHEFPVDVSFKDIVINNNDAPNGQKYFDILCAGEHPTSVSANSTATFDIRVTAKVITPDAHTSNFTVGITATTRANS